MTRLHILTLFGLLPLAACAGEVSQAKSETMSVPSAKAQPVETDYAIYAGGCFWCVESDFEKLDGVYEVISGYSGGETDNPTYKNHSQGGHREVAKIVFDPTVVSYRQLTDYFFRHVDPLDDGGQFCDRGFTYTTAIYTNSDEQRAIAAASKAEANKELGKTVVTPILDEATFWPAEEYHQDYYKKNPVRYNFYRNGCGRDKQVAKVWGKKSK